MTSSDAERGDGGVDKRQDTGECPSTDEDAKTATADDDQADVQASTLPSDGTASPAADRKENSDKPETETETALSGALFAYLNVTVTVKGT